MRRLLALSLVALLGFPAAAAGQARPRDKLRDRVVQKLRDIRDRKLVDPLGLPADRRAQVIQILNDYEDRITPHRRANARAYFELKALVDARKNDEAKINRLLDEIVAGQKKIQALEHERTEALREVLTAEESAKMAVLYPRVALELGALVLKALSKNRD